MPAEHSDGGRGQGWKRRLTQGAAGSGDQAAGLGVIGVDHVLDQDGIERLVGE